MERVADGQDVVGHEPFRMEPPASPHLSVIWLALGHLQRLSGAPALGLARGLAVVSVGLLSAGAWILGRRLFGPGLMPELALLLFWLSLPETWSAVVLGRYVGLAFVALAAASALSLGQAPRAVAATAAFVALAFYVHLFGGVLAAGAVLIVVFARWRCGEAPGLRDVALALGGGAVLAAPCLVYALTTLGLARTSAHSWRPEQVEAFGWRLLSPGQILDLVPAVALGLALLGLVVPVPGTRRVAQEIARTGTVVAVLVLFSPLYQVAVQAFGAWMVGRVAALAFPWLAATLFLESMLLPPARWRVAVAAALVTAVAAQGALRAASDWRGGPYEFTVAARDEAFGLRPTLRGRTYLAPSPIGYGLAAPTLGRPLAVPPGHASPFGDFRRQERRVHRALAANTEECWAALFGLYPHAEFLLTPAPGATVERRIWRELFPQTSPEAVRDRLSSLGTLQPVREGPVFVLDALRSAPLLGGRRVPHRGMGSGPHCREGREDP